MFLCESKQRPCCRDGQALCRLQAQFQSPSLQVLNPQLGSQGLSEKHLCLPFQPCSLPHHLTFSTHQGVPLFPG